jgi:hypothetical protein
MRPNAQSESDRIIRQLAPLLLALGLAGIELAPDSQPDRIGGVAGGGRGVNGGEPMTGTLAQSEALWYAVGMASVTTTLRTALEQCGQTRYAVSKATGIPESTLSRFVAGGKPMRGENIDKLCTYLGLVLTQKPGKRRKGS